MEKTPLPAFPGAKTIARICRGSQRCPIRAVSYTSCRDCGIAARSRRAFTQLEASGRICHSCLHARSDLTCCVSLPLVNLTDRL
jgi:hypothetical protein